MRIQILLLILCMAAITYALRFLPILLLRRVTLPHWLSRYLRFIPVAVLSTLIFPAVFMPQGSLFLSIQNSYLLAGAITVAVTLKTKNTVAAILAGMAAVLLLRVCLGWS